MNLYQKIKELANLRNISVAQIERDLNFSNGSISKWGESLPSIDKVEKVANYFNVTIDYLLGRTEDPFSNGNELDWNDVILKDPEEEDLIAAFRLESEDMDDEEKQKFNQSLKGMMKIARGLLDDDSKWKD